jgi:hypothetical protein
MIRLLIAILVIALCVWKLWPKPPQPGTHTSPTEKILYETQEFEDEYIQANQDRMKEMERRGDGG